MTKLPVISSDKLIKILQKSGFTYAPKRGKGSHVALFKTDLKGIKRLVIIPKRSNIPRGTLLSIIDQSGISKEEFIELIKK
ncbi:MAG: type II toxin-antitoxin system HicA family toxin [Candidatus Schekmanbacteria bacterium]|nr:type II toxin-antitoxin system HicA family toxin [Candidatus Schekmanbacteria bacterium]